jgi:hypothetical protein
MQALKIGGQQTYPTMFSYNRVQVRALYVFSETRSRCRLDWVQAAISCPNADTPNSTVDTGCASSGNGVST